MPEPTAELVEPTRADIDGLLALSSASNWNQNPDDWLWMLEHGRTRALRVDGRLIASTLVLPWSNDPIDSGASALAAAPAPPAEMKDTEPGPHSASAEMGSTKRPPASLAWISMVLVLPEHRGQGHARTLLRESLAWLRQPSQGHLLALLDATPAGRPVYLREGFTDLWGFSRWERRSESASVPRRLPPDRSVSLSGPSVTASMLNAVLGLDRIAFGASRARLIEDLIRRAPALARADLVDGDLRGFILARPGRVATQIGPLIARDRHSAETLLDQTLSTVSGPTFIDVPDNRSELAALLTAQGFTRQRPFTRMVLDPASPSRPAPVERDTPELAGNRALIWAVAGPELG